MDTKPWVEDQWYKHQKDSDGNPVPTTRHGKGMRWKVYWWDGTHIPAVRRSKSFPRKTDAQRELAALNTEFTKGTYTPPGMRKTLIGEICDMWLASKVNIADSTYSRYARETEMYVKPRWERTQIGRLKRSDAEKWVRDLLDGTAPVYFKSGKQAEPCAPAYARHIIKTFLQALNWAVKHGYVPQNPIRGIELPEKEDLPHFYLTHEMVDDLANAAFDVKGSSVDYTLVLTLAYTGARIGEATAMNVEDFLIPRRRLVVNKTWTVDREGKRHLSRSPKHNSRRNLPIPDFLMPLLVELTDGQPPDAPLFRVKTGQHVNQLNWRNRVFNKAVTAAGLEGKDVTPHTLRHTAASLAIASGADVKMVQLMMGHKDASETLNTYGHLWPDQLDSVSQAMSAARTVALEGSRRELEVS